MPYFHTVITGASWLQLVFALAVMPGAVFSVNSNRKFYVNDVCYLLNICYFSVSGQVLI